MAAAATTTTQTTSSVETIASSSRNKDVLDYFLKAADFFLPEGNREKYFDDYWSFYAIDGLLRSWAIPFKEELADASYEEIVKFIHDLLKEEKTAEASVPNKDLLEELEMKADAARQKELQLRELVRQQSTDLINKLTKTPVRPEIKTLLSNELANNFFEEISPTDLPILTEKVKEQPPEERIKLQREIDQKLEQAWRRAVERTSRAVLLTREEKAYLERMSSNVESPQNLTQPEQANNIAKLLSPLNRERAQLFTISFLNNFVQNLPENLTANTIEEAALISVWQMVEQTKVKLSGEEIAKAIETFVPKTEEQSIEFRRFFSQVRSPLGPLESSKTAEAKQTRFHGDILRVLSDNEPVIQRVKKQLYTYGININPESDNKLLDLKLKIQSLVLTRAGFTPQDIAATVDSLTKKGVQENSPQIVELRKVQQSLLVFINDAKVAGLSQKQLQKWQEQAVTQAKKGIQFNLPYSSIGTVIQKAGIFPKSIALKIPAFGNLVNGITNWFLKTGVGKAIHFSLEKSALAGWQALWNAGTNKFIKGTLAKGVTSLLAKVGITLASNVAAPITAAIVFLAPKLLGMVKKIGGFVLSGFGIANFLLSALGQGDSERDSKMLQWVLIGTFVAIFFFSTFQSSYTLGGAFVSSGRGGMEDEIGPGVNPIGSTIDCTRQDMHLGEQVICQLSKRDDPCNQTRISTLTWDKVLSCFAKNETNFQNKETIKSIFSNSIIVNGNLQCVGFITAIQLALLKGLDKMGDACSYAHGNPPSGYVYIRASQIGEIQKGDIAVWDDSLCGAENHWGHVGIVVNRDGETKIDVAQANGKNGEIDVKGYPLDNPTLYLRYSH